MKRRMPIYKDTISTLRIMGTTTMTKPTPHNGLYKASQATDVDTVLTTLATQGWAKNINAQSNVRVLSANELTSISALIAYVAYNSGETEFRIERRVADRFNVANVTCLPSAEYDKAVRYLVDSSAKISKM